MTNMTRFLASLVSAALILVSPGHAWAAAMGRVRVGNVAGRVGTPIQLQTPSLGMSLNGAPKLTTSLTPALQTAPQAVPRLNAAAPTGVITAPGAEIGVNPAAEQAVPVIKIAEQAAPIVESIAEAPITSDPTFSHDAGLQLEGVMTGVKTRRGAGEVYASASFAPINTDNGSFLAKPAGDSIRQAAEAAPDTNGPTPPNNNDNNGRGEGGGGPPGKGPLLPKLMAVGIALIPAALIGWPLIAAGAYLYGGLVVAGSASLGSMVFMSDRTSSLVRSIPGVAIGALGAATLISGVASLAWLPLTMGTLVTLGGWGFTRFARKDLKDRSIDSKEVISTFFGTLAAVTGAGLVLLTAPAWASVSIVPLSYVGTSLLLMHLPGWVGRGIESAARNIVESLEGVYKTQTSLRRDTSLYKRLDRFTTAALDASIWNAIWVGLVLWLPVLISEAVQAVLSGAVGLAVGVAQIPLMFLAGATQSKYIEGVAKTTFDNAQGSKTGWFNRYESKLVPAANSDNVFKRVPAALAIRLGQWAWLVATLVTGTVGQLAALFKPTEGKRELPSDPNRWSGELPQVKVTAVLPGKIIAVLVGLAPLYFFGGALAFGGGPFGWLVVAGGLLTAIMPLTPWAGRYAALLMTLGGGWAAFQGARIMLLAALPTGWIIAAGVFALLGGIGLSALIKKLRDPETKKWQVDEGPYVLGYAGALGVSTALLVALSGLTSPVGLGLMIGGMVLSAPLLYHLPKWLWTGVGEAIWGVFKPVGSTFRAGRKLWTGTEAFENVNKAYGKAFEGKHWTYAIVLGLVFAIPFAITDIVLPLIEFAISLASGLAVGATQIVPNFFGGASPRFEKWAKRVAELQQKAEQPKSFWGAAGWFARLLVTSVLAPLTWLYAAFTVK